jgi:uncharacterized membrane protein (DUF485 family)
LYPIHILQVYKPKPKNTNARPTTKSLKNKMKNFHQWLNAFIAVIIIIVLTDLNIAWIKHPAGKTTMMVIRISCALILVTLIVWNIYKQKTSKKE